MTDVIEVKRTMKFIDDNNFTGSDYSALRALYRQGMYDEFLDLAYELGLVDG